MWIVTWTYRWRRSANRTPEMRGKGIKAEASHVDCQTPYLLIGLSWRCRHHLTYVSDLLKWTTYSPPR
jgi:hypothetical protein